VSLSVIVTAFLFVAVAELPDKSMIATLVMGTQARPVLVWLGASLALCAHAVLAVAAGRLLELLPHKALEIVVTVLFVIGAAYLLFVPEKDERAKGEKEAEGAGPTLDFKVIATVFGVIFIGEFGDLTQILMVNLVARFHQPWSVLVGSALALSGVAALGAFGGRALLRVLPLQLIRRIGGFVLLGFAIYSLVTVLR
jgi:putative Ca2+/H+ antiporter (TMEM165/GDT1 family)